ncbi:MAG: hypothetical protein ACK55I_00425, partial [bacterium]
VRAADDDHAVLDRVVGALALVAKLLHHALEGHLGGHILERHGDGVIRADAHALEGLPVGIEVDLAHIAHVVEHRVELVAVELERIRLAERSHRLAVGRGLAVA